MPRKKLNDLSETIRKTATLTLWHYRIAVQIGENFSDGVRLALEYYFDNVLDESNTNSIPFTDALENEEE